MSDFYAICFDVKNKRRLRRVSLELENFGHRVQYSLFECLLDDNDLQTLKQRLAQLIDPDQDHVSYYRLCPKDVPAIRLDGSGEVTTEPDFHMI